VASIDSAHRRNGWDGIGYHFVIGNGHGMRLGQVEPTFRWTRQREGAHAGGGAKGKPYNQLGIGIVLVGNFNEGPPDPWQEERLVELICELQRHVPTLDRARIIGHGDVPGKDSDCPGTQLHVDRIRYLVQVRLEDESVGVPTAR
jgi:N-acetyl-anhydromuramyl-L-alanine amidase AmpD